MSLTRTTRSDLNRLPIGYPVASSWPGPSRVIIESVYSVMKPKGNSLVRT